MSLLVVKIQLFMNDYACLQKADVDSVYDRIAHYYQNLPL